MEKFYGNWYQSSSFSLINVGNGFFTVPAWLIHSVPSNEQTASNKMWYSQSIRYLEQLRVPGIQRAVVVKEIASNKMWIS